jgi:pimeloyl-ACP methyl ester carboxylesterase
VKRLALFPLPVVLIGIFYFLGPSPDPPHWNRTLPAVPQQPMALERYVTDQEGLHKLKPGNEARIVWNDDSLKEKTEYCVVYLHGFSASEKEGDPIHLKFAKAFGCNLFLARLADHGVDTTEQLLGFTVDRFWESAKQALVIGKALGKKVILMSTSTGGTIALVLASEYPTDVACLINMSPNIAINNPSAFLLNNHWGLQIARLVVGGDYQVVDYPPERLPYWNERYRLESLVQLQELLEDKMTNDVFQRVVQPSLTLYYYKDEAHQDPTVKVSAILKMQEELGTPDSLKVAVAIPNAGAHVMGSYLVSKDLATVYLEAERFAVGKMHMIIVDSTARLTAN